MALFYMIYFSINGVSKFASNKQFSAVLPRQHLLFKERKDTHTDSFMQPYKWDGFATLALSRCGGDPIEVSDERSGPTP